MFKTLRQLLIMQWRSKRLRTAADGETDPGVLLGLACGAHMAYSNGVAWNAITDPRADQEFERTRLRSTWGVTSSASWQSTLHRLLDANVSTPDSDLAVRVRDGFAHAYGFPPVDPAWWEGIIRALADSMGPAAPARRTAAVWEQAQRIPRYEARFREDGLLPPNAWVNRTVAWDVGRAANMACWGVHAGFAHPDEARAALRTAGAQVQKAYGSWQAYSTAYVLGRCLHFDRDNFGSWYRQVRDSHRLLTSRPDSPWNTLPLH